VRFSESGINTDVYIIYVLSAEEAIIVLRLHHKKGVVSSELFKCEQRKVKKKEPQRILRFTVISKSDWDSSLLKDAIYFKLSHNGTLHGICMYPSMIGTLIMLNDLTISTEDERVLYKSNHVVKQSSNGDIVDVMLNQSIDIKKNVKYLIHMHIQGRYSCYGIDGKNEIQHSFVIVKFYNYHYTHHSSTNVNRGQIPGLLLSFSQRST